MDATSLGGLVALMTTAIATMAVMPALRRWNLVDVPSDRSSHVEPTLRAGGIGVAVGSLVAVSTSPLVGREQAIGLAMFATACGIIGLADDIRDLPIVARLLLQIALAGTVMVWLVGGSAESHLAQALLGLAGFLWLVGYVNAFNFFDGINGIAIAQAVVAGSVWYVLGQVESAPDLSNGAIIIAGSALAFAPFNFPRARVFLGDVGSYFIGGWLALLAVLGVEAGIPVEAVLAPLMVSLADTAGTRLRRLREGDHWYLPNRDHVYQRLTQLGWTHTRTTLVALAAMTICSVLGTASLSTSLALRIAGDVGVVIVVGMYISMPTWIRPERVESPR